MFISQIHGGKLDTENAEYLNPEFLQHAGRIHATWVTTSYLD
jgi:hypothetical protein